MHRGLITHLERAIINAEIRLIRTIINYTEASEHARPSVSSGINRFCYAWFQRGDIRNRDTISYFRVIFTPTASHVFSPISRSPCLSTLSNLFFAAENWGLLFFFLLIKFSKIKFSIIDKNFDRVRRIFWKLRKLRKRKTIYYDSKSRNNFFQIIRLLVRFYYLDIENTTLWATALILINRRPLSTDR